MPSWRMPEGASRYSTFRAAVLSRLRFLLWLDLSLSVALLLIDLTRSSAAGPTPLRTAYVVEILWSLTWIGLAGRRGAIARGGAVLAVFGVHTLQLTAGLLAGDVAASAVLCSGSALIVAFIVPWGATTQAVSAALAAMLILLQAGAVADFSGLAIGPSLALPLAILFASVLVAADADRKSTAELAMRAELRLAHGELEARVARRTTELVEARNVAERANRARQSLIAHTSHDLRTPINVIWGYKDMLADSGLNGEQLDYVERIARATDQLRRLSNDLLDLLRADVGQVQVREQEFSLEGVVARSVEPFEPAADARKVQLAFEIEPDVPDRLLGDPHRVRQILTNLVGNAVKFTPDGEIRIAIALDEAPTPRAPPDDRPRLGVRFEVRDTGIGLTQDDQKHVFEEFSQIDGAHYEGSGLGLAICRRFVEILGGQIGVRSELGAGSTFWFTLPFARPEAARSTAAGSL